MRRALGSIDAGLLLLIALGGCFALDPDRPVPSDELPEVGSGSLGPPLDATTPATGPGPSDAGVNAGPDGNGSPGEGAGDTAGAAAPPAAGGLQGADCDGGGTPVISADSNACATVPTPAGDGGSGLDVTFGDGGTLAIAAVNPQGEVSVAVQADGKILIAGESAVPGQGSFLLRLLPDGAFDPSFSNGSPMFVPLGINSLAPLASDKLLVAGFTSVGTIQRYNEDGSLDSTFGSAGSVMTSIGASVIAVEPGGNVVVGGSIALDGGGGSFGLAVARLLADGAADPTFGQGGIASSASVGNVTTLGLETDGSILALSSSEAITIVRFSATGAEEPVAVCGSVTQVAVSNTTEFATFRANGDVLAAGAAPGIAKGHYGRIYRYALPGILDPNFGVVFNWGLAAPDVNSVPEAIAVAPDGTIVAGGTATTSTTGQYLFGFGAFDSNGCPNTGFASGGLTTTEISGDDEVFTVAVQPDGNVLAVGVETSSGSGQPQLVLARYLAP